jgi:tetratricopeptide (TPR) repeat protein
MGTEAQAHSGPARRPAGGAAWLAAILAVTAAAFWPSLRNGFTNWDDPYYIALNEQIRDLSWDGIRTIFTSFSVANYHPLVGLTNALEYRFFGLDPTPYHVVNLILHLANTALVFRLVLLLAARLEAAVIAATFFGIHPMHVESVAWIAERKDVLYAGFYLGSMICYLRYLRSGLPGRLLLATLALCLMSLLSKSAAVVLPATLLLLDLHERRQASRRMVLEKVPFLVLSLAFGVAALFSQSGSDTLDTLQAFSPVQRFFITAHALFFYPWKLAWPFGLSAFHGFPVLGRPLPPAYLAAPVVLLAVGVAVLRSRGFRRDLLFGLGFYLVNVLLVVQILPVGPTAVSERYSYVSYVGLLLIAGRAYCEVADGRWRLPHALRALAAPATAAFAVLCAVLTWQRCHVWKDGITLFSDVLERERMAPLPYYNRGMARYEAGDFAGAIRDFDAAIALHPEDVDYFLNRGVARFALNDVAGALSDFRETLRLDPDHVEGLMNCASAEATLNDHASALRHFDRAIALDPGRPLGYFNRGALYMRLNDRESACRDWTRAADLGYAGAASLLDAYCRK